MDHDWFARVTHDAAQLPSIFTTWTDDPFEIHRLPRLIELRNLAMADHVQWVLEHEGPDGKDLLFQANGHGTTAPVIESVMRLFAHQPKVTGALLRERLGRDYRATMSISSQGRDAGDASLGSVDRAFAAAGRPPVLLDLASSPCPSWWSRLQSASEG